MFSLKQKLFAEYYELFTKNILQNLNANLLQKQSGHETLVLLEDFSLHAK